MRVILKPIGLISLLLTIASLSLIAYGYGRWFGVKGGDSGKLLDNGSFDLPFLHNEAKSGNSRTQISGDIAPGWFDNSAWGDVTIVYSRDETKPYRGQAAQKIEFREVKNNYGRLQFAQVVEGKLGGSGTFRSRVYARASEPVEVEFGLRIGTGEEGKYLTHPVRFKLDKGWQKLETTQTVGKDGKESFLMFNCEKPGVTLWVDEATVERVGP